MGVIVSRLETRHSVHSCRAEVTDYGHERALQGWMSGSWRKDLIWPSSSALRLVSKAILIGHCVLHTTFGWYQGIARSLSLIHI